VSPSPIPWEVLPGFDTVAEWENDPLDFDLIVLATPLSVTTRLLRSWRGECRAA